MSWPPLVDREELRVLCAMLRLALWALVAGGIIGAITGAALAADWMAR